MRKFFLLPYRLPPVCNFRYSKYISKRERASNAHRKEVTAYAKCYHHPQYVLQEVRIGMKIAKKLVGGLKACTSFLFFHSLLKWCHYTSSNCYYCLIKIRDHNAINKSCSVCPMPWHHWLLENGTGCPRPCLLFPAMPVSLIRDVLCISYFSPCYGVLY